MNFVFWAKIKHDANFDAKHDDWLQRRIWALSKYVTTCSCLSSKEAVSHAVFYKIRTSIRPYTWSTTKILTCDLFAVANFFSVSWIDNQRKNVPWRSEQDWENAGYWHIPPCFDFIEGSVLQDTENIYDRECHGWITSKSGPGCSLLQKRIRATDRQEQWLMMQPTRGPWMDLGQNRTEITYSFTHRSCWPGVHYLVTSPHGAEFSVPGAAEPLNLCSSCRNQIVQGAPIKNNPLEKNSISPELQQIFSPDLRCLQRRI